VYQPLRSSVKEMPLSRTAASVTAWLAAIALGLSVAAVSLLV
jgi:hypothetical protein